MASIVRLITPAAKGGKHPGLDAFTDELFDELAWEGDPDLDFAICWGDNNNKNIDGIAQEVVQKENANLIVTDGSMATQSAYKYAPSTIGIIQAVGGIQVNDSKNQKNLTGFYIDTLRTCKEQLIKFGPKKVSVLFDHTNDAAQDTYDKLVAFAKMLLFEKNLDPIDIQDVKNFDDSKIKGDAFMLIPNAIYYNAAIDIGKAVKKKDVPAIYPEREYRKGHNDKRKAKIHGHHVPFTFRLAARLVDQILSGQQMVGHLNPITEADRDQSI
jgi:hypothetical protein